MFYFICQTRNFVLYPAGCLSDAKIVRMGLYKDGFLKSECVDRLKKHAPRFSEEHAFGLNDRVLAHTGMFRCHLEEKKPNFHPQGSLCIHPC